MADSSDDYSYIAKKLREHRLACGLKLEDVGKVVNRRPSAVSNWELGANEPSSTIMIQLCKLYKAPISDFYPPELNDFSSSEIITMLIEDPLAEELMQLWAEMDQRGRDAIIALARSLSLSEDNQHQVHKTA